ncbi:MAG: ATP synthase F1 subunit gamma [Deltaproteobacteria bacterium]|jgi:F-type H+-transporting ATPase subunit gamma|nr:ATP synthase F1 subunit gamma [Deltaproteobacteria bacterium]
MASLKDIKRHITAVRQTQKLTKAMNMVAAAKLRATQGRTEKLKEYADEFDRLLAEIGRRSGTVLADFLKPPENSKKAMVVVISSDRGLCGSFNSNVFSVADKLVKQLRERGLEVSVFMVGRKAFDYYSRRKGSRYKAHVGVMNNVDFKMAKTISSEIREAYMDKKDPFCEIHIVHTSFENINRHPARASLFLPLAPEEASTEVASVSTDVAPASEHIDYLMEPPPEDFLERLVKNALNNRIFRALLESVTSENAARMQAMDNASSSCKDIIESLTMAYNKARQSSVTNELLDIVNGAEALKG